MSSDQIPVSNALAVRPAAQGVDLERVGQLAGLPAGLLSERRVKVRLTTHQILRRLARPRPTERRSRLWSAVGRRRRAGTLRYRVGRRTALRHDGRGPA